MADKVGKIIGAVTVAAVCAMFVAGAAWVCVRIVRSMLGGC